MDNGNKERLIAKIICVILAFALWLYVTNVENPTRTSSMSGVEVKVQNEDVLKNSNLALTPGQEFNVDLKLEGPSNEIYSAKKSDFNVVLDLNSYALKEGENTIPVQVVDYPSGISIKNEGLLYVKVNIEPLIEKEVKVTSAVKTTYKNGFSQNSLNISPKSIKVSGAKSSVEKVAEVHLVGNASDIDENFQKDFNLIAVDSNGDEVKGIELSEQKGFLSIGVGTRKEVSIVANSKGTLADGLNLEGIALETQKVTIMGSNELINKIAYISTEDVDLSNITDTKSLDLNLIIPNGVVVINDIKSVKATVNIKKIESNTDESKDETITKVIDNVKVTLKDKNDKKFNYDVSNISVTVSGSKDDLSKITSDAISATASVADVTETGEKEVVVNVNLLNESANVKIISKPDKVKIKVSNL
ncbi:MAG: CdaR family protein [Clostridiaceae bacterium]|nr:CdaR family protein [Clostridiaceae bacterium]